MDSTVVMYIAGLIVLLVILWLVGKSSGGRWSLAEIREAIGTLVEAAEQMMPGESGQDKLSYVMAKADELGLTRYIHPTLLRAMIESSVYWLRTGQRVASHE